jgi:diguanylate cyclase
VIPTHSVPVTPASRADPRFAILCIEDDRAISTIYERRLSALGAHVRCAGSSREGYAAATEGTPDLILMDNGLPDEEGVHLVGRLKSHPTTAAVPVLMLTGSDTPTIRRRLLTLGVIGVLEKPVDFDELIEQIRQLALSSLSGRTLELASAAP